MERFFDFLEQIGPVAIILVFAVVGWIVNIVKSIRGPAQGQGPREVGRRAPADPDQAPAARDIEEFLETLRGGRPANERDADAAAGGAEPAAERRAAAAEAQDFAPPGGRDFEPARDARVEQARGEWEQLEWEPVPLEEHSARQRRQRPPRAARPAQASRLPGAPPRPELTKEQREAADAMAARLTASKPSGAENPTWFSLAEIVSPEAADRILDVPVDKAIAIREILGPPRGVKPWHPRGWRS